MRSALRRLALFLLIGALLAAAAWSAAAIYFSERLGQSGPVLAGAFLLVLTAAAVLVRPIRSKILACVVPVLGVLTAYLLQAPVMNAEWQDDVARLPMAEISGDMLKLRNINKAVPPR